MDISYIKTTLLETRLGFRILLSPKNGNLKRNLLSPTRNQPAVPCFALGTVRLITRRFASILTGQKALGFRFTSSILG